MEKSPEKSPLHPSIVALVALAANIAANHPKQGLCQLERLRHYGISEEQIGLAVEIARHIRDEAGGMLDASFDVAARIPEEMHEARPAAADAGASTAPAACCTPTAEGKACC